MESKTQESFIKLIKGKKTKKEDIISFLKNNDFDINSLDKHGYNPLHYAIKLEKIDIIDIMLNFKSENEDEIFPHSNPNIITNDIKNQIITSPLLLALMHTDDYDNSNSIIKLLIRSGADLNYKDEEGCTLFLRSCEKGRLDIISYIIEKYPKLKLNENEENKKFNINKEISKSGGGLHLAILGRNDEIINYLLEQGIDLGIQNDYGNTVFHLSLMENEMNIFKQLLDFLVDNKNINNETKKKILNTQNKEGNTILHELSIAKSNILTNMVKKLPKDIGVDEDIKNNDGYNYIELGEHLVEIEKKKKEHEQELKKEYIRQKEEIRQKTIEENKKISEQKKRFQEQMERQEEFGRKLIKYRGFIFFGGFVIFMGILYVLLTNATKKKDVII